MFLNWTGDTPAVRSVLIDSALGLGAPPRPWFLRRMADVDSYLSNMPPPSLAFYPNQPDQPATGGRGQEHLPARLRLVSRTAGRAHEQGDSDRGDRDRSGAHVVLVESCRRGSQSARKRIGNRSSADDRARSLWLHFTAARRHLAARALLHNGSVPTLRDLLNSPTTTAHIPSRLRCFRPDQSGI